MSLRNTQLLPRYFHNNTGFYCCGEPRILGAYSVNEESEFVNSLDNLKYLHLPDKYKLGDSLNDPHWDLKKGLNTYKYVGETSKKIDNLLSFVIANPDKVKSNGNLPDVICCRSVLTELLHTPFRHKDFRGWGIVASRYRGITYLYLLSKKDSKTNFEPRETELFEGKYQHLITTSDLNVPSNPSDPVLKKIFCMVFQTQFGQNQILSSGMIDAIQSDVPINSNDDLFENTDVKPVKLCLSSKTLQLNQLNQLKNIWYKSITAGVETVYLGFKNENDILEKIEAVKVEDIPAECNKDQQKPWNPSICMKFCMEFFNTVKSVMANVDDPNAVFKFNFNPQISDRIQYEVFAGMSEMSFLPTWYQDFIEASDSNLKN